jgi:hypothetical protein
LYILTEMNTSFDMNDLPDEVDDLNYCVLDYSDQNAVDFYFPPLLYLDHFTRDAADLRIGNAHLQMPLDWSIIIADKNLGSVEIIELSQINDRDFETFGFNPFTSSMPVFHEIIVENTFPDISWYMPKLSNGHILAVPITAGANPMCAYFLRDVNKIPDHLDITKLF